MHKPLSLIHQGEDSRSKKLVEWKLQLQKVRQDDMAEGYVSIKKQDKTPVKQLTKVGISNLPEKKKKKKIRIMRVKMI